MNAPAEELEVEGDFVYSPVSHERRYDACEVLFARIFSAR
jgi:hypothetical protein